MRGGETAVRGGGRRVGSNRGRGRGYLCPIRNKHTDRVFPSSACEPLDRKHTDRVFPSSACEPFDRKHTDRVFPSSSCEPFDRKHTDRVLL